MIRKSLIVGSTASAVGITGLWVFVYLAVLLEGYHSWDFALGRIEDGSGYDLELRHAGRFCMGVEFFAEKWYEIGANVTAFNVASPADPRRLHKEWGYALVSFTLWDDSGKGSPEDPFLGGAAVQAFFPLWIPTLLLWIYPIICFMRGPWKRRRRKRRGLCLNCSYLLRGLTDNRCPECGTPFDPSELEPLTGSIVEDATQS